MPKGRQRINGEGAQPHQYKREGVPYHKKLDIINYYRDHGMKATLSRFFSAVAKEKLLSKRKQVNKWSQAREKIEAYCSIATSGTKMKQCRGGTATTLPLEVENDLVRWINELREDGLPVTPAMLRAQALETAKAHGISGFVGGSLWMNRFRSRHRLSLRARTRQGQMSPPDAEKVALEFARKVKEVMNGVGITKVYNADQTAILYEYLPKRTLASRGAKTVWVRGTNKAKERVSAMLLADAEGNKFPPFVVLKAPPSSVPELEYENLALRNGFGERVWVEVSDLQLETGMSIYGNFHGWWNSVFSVEILRVHFARRANISEPILLLWDDFSGHWTAEVIAYARRINVHLPKFPPALPQSISQRTRLG